MSTYQKITRHPITKNYEVATYRDDYFGDHIYGIEFPSDGKVFTAELVDPKQVKTFWVEDVIKALEDRFQDSIDTNIEVVGTLNRIEAQYKARWERDPVNGEGAISWAGLLKKVEK